MKLEIDEFLLHESHTFDLFYVIMVSNSRIFAIVRRRTSPFLQCDFTFEVFS
jgi:hypothetical protein